MCRGCLFVIVDIESGGDIDGCWKMEILEDLAGEFPNDPIIKKKLENIEQDLDEEKCFVGFWQPKPLNEEEFKKQAKEWMITRQLVIANYEREWRQRLAAVV